MSITALQVEALPATGGASVRGWLNDIDAVLARAGRLDVSAGTDAALVESARRLTAVLSRVAAVKLAVLAEVDPARRGPAHHRGHVHGGVVAGGWDESGRGPPRGPPGRGARAA